jgi:hypothetical protein
VRRAFRFRPTSDRPLVLDGSAGAGVAVLYFKALFPHCRVVACEADPAAFAALERNVRTYVPRDVRLLPATFWSAVDSGLSLHADCTGDEAPAHIDLLKLHVSSPDCARLTGVSALLAGVESVVLDYHAPHGRPQNLAPLFDALEAAGFRVAVQSRDAGVTQPLVTLPSSGGRESWLRILGFRL